VFRHPASRWGAAVLFSAMLLAPLPALADEDEEGVFNFVIENDLFLGSDRHYTNGFQASWTTGPNRVPVWMLKAARWLPLFPEGGTVRANYAFGQSMYTPADISLPNPPLSDRPYAGWLYASLGLVAKGETDLDQLQLQVGMVGPASFAEQTQKFVHKIIGSQEPMGWNYQLKNEPGVVLTYQHSWRTLSSSPSPFGFKFDLTPHAGAALGNVFTYANAGATIRFGWNLPDDYGPPRVQPSLPASGFFESQSSFGWYLFAGVEGRAIARNIFLDGNTFADSRSVSKEPLVGDLQFGIAFTLGHSTRLAYTQVFRTREFSGQREADKFGAISLSMRF
jgi:hypothetical protein